MNSMEISEQIKRIVARFKSFSYERAVNLPLNKQIITFASTIKHDELDSKFLINFLRSKFGQEWCEDNFNHKLREPVQVSSISADKVKKLGSLTSTNPTLIHEYLIIKRSESLLRTMKKYGSKKTKLKSLRDCIAIVLIKYLGWGWENRTEKIFFNIEILKKVDTICEELGLTRIQVINYLILEGILKIDSN
jgi:hypothetical protein